MAVNIKKLTKRLIEAANKYEREACLSKALRKKDSLSDRLDILRLAMWYFNFPDSDQDSEDERVLAKRLSSVLGEISYYKEQVNYSKEIAQVLAKEVTDATPTYFYDKYNKLAGTLFHFKDSEASYWGVIIDSVSLLSKEKYSTRKEAIENAVASGYTPFVLV